MEAKILKALRFLKIYAVILTLAFVALFTLSFTNKEKVENKSFKEITAQRINIVGPQGKLRMVISNSDMQSPGRMNGKKLPDRQRHQGMIFFNEEGDEVGGLIFGNRGLVLSVDKYKQDQIMQLQYMENKSGKARYGLQFWDREGKLNVVERRQARDSLKKLHYSRKKMAKILTQMNGQALAPHRMFVGKLATGAVGLFIRDKEGHKRIMLGVANNNQVYFKVFDSTGKEVALKELN